MFGGGSSLFRHSAIGDSPASAIGDSRNLTSSLHDLFGAGSGESEATAGTLTFTRPQQPSERPAAAEPAAASGSTTLYAQLVQVFQDVGGAWQPVGQSGLALVGGPAAAAYQLVLYDAGNKKPFSVTTVANLALTPQSAQYLSFVDGQVPCPRALRLLCRGSTLISAAICVRTARPPDRRIRGRFTLRTSSRWHRALFSSRSLSPPPLPSTSPSSSSPSSPSPVALSLASALTSPDRYRSCSSTSHSCARRRQRRRRWHWQRRRQHRRRWRTARRRLRWCRRWRWARGTLHSTAMRWVCACLAGSCRMRCAAPRLHWASRRALTSALVLSPIPALARHDHSHSHSRDRPHSPNPTRRVPWSGAGVQRRRRG